MFDAALLLGKRILVTGGGTGLGKEMAVGFAAHGAHVYICGRRSQVLDQAVREIRERSGGGADAVVANDDLARTSWPLQSRCCVRISRRSEANDSATWHVGACPQSSVMCFDNRAADR